MPAPATTPRHRRPCSGVVSCAFLALAAVAACTAPDDPTTGGSAPGPVGAVGEAGHVARHHSPGLKQLPAAVAGGALAVGD